MNNISNSPLGSKSNVYERDRTNFDQENFILDDLAECWNSVFEKEQASKNLSFQSFLCKINFILDKFVLLKRFSQHKLKFKIKPWISSDMQRSISM